ncbi:MAG: lactonase family protein [Acidobacteriota bacterium]|nr:lactonase family protein [Acidobacteriota bacterium]
MYVGTYTGKNSKGIYAYRFDPATGESSAIGLVAATDNPSFLAVASNNRFLYAVNELDKFEDKSTGAVSAFAIDRKTGKLNLLQQVSSLGGGPAHLSEDKAGRYLLVANYDGGSVAVFPIESNGRLGQHTAFIQHVGSSVNPERQAGPHAHSILVSNDNRFAVSADLGLDQVLVYRFDAQKGSLAANDPKFATVDPGSGPRHLTFAPSGDFLYVVDEMASAVTVFAYDASQGRLQNKQTVSTLPPAFHGQDTAAEIMVDANGRFLYVSSRGADSIAIFAIKPGSGALSPVEVVPTGGKTPRNFAIDPTGKWLFAANQDSNKINLFRIDPGTGRLTRTSQVLQLTSPVCIVFVPTE